MQLVLEINVLKLNNESKGRNLETYFTNLNFNWCYFGPTPVGIHLPLHQDWKQPGVERYALES